MMVRAEGRTDLGLVRQNNEDSFFISTELGLFAVADGMGGALAGEVASNMALDVLRDYLTRALAGDEALVGTGDGRYSLAANRLASGIRLANRVVHEAAGSQAGWSKMGTTIAAVLLDGTRLAVAHVGDSRIYLIRNGSIAQLTNDHSLVAEQVRRGLLSPEEAAASKLRNVITRAIGQGPDVEVDLDEIEVMVGDRILLCSDGLTNMVSDEVILTTVANEIDPGTACNILIDLANEGGGKDNVTLVVVAMMDYGFLAGLSKLFRRGR